MSETSDKVSEENSRKIHENTKKHSDKFELNNEYTEIINNIGKSHETFSDSHKDEILRMAKILDQVGDTKKENICSKVAKDLEDAGIKKRYVYKILPDEYKRDYDKQKCPRALSEMIGNDPDQKKPIEITNDGSQITSSDEKSSEYYDLDEIHGGKSLEQMRREANHEIEEDKEGTLENPSNMLRETPNPAKESLVNTSTTTPKLLSDTPPEVRDMEVRISELEEALRIQKEEAETKGKRYFELKRQYLQNSPENLRRENTELKVMLNNLKTLYEDSNESVKEELGYKEVELFKLDSTRVTWLLQTSKSSERTLFLVVNPKTKEIVEVKTDKEMHRIQVRRKHEQEIAEEEAAKEQQPQQQEKEVRS